MTKTMTEAQRAYEEKRAAKAGVSLDKWVTQKNRAKAEQLRAAAPPAPPRAPSLWQRLLDRAHKPLKPKA